MKVNDIQPHLRVINLFQCSPGFATGPRRLYAQYFLYVHHGKGEITIGDTTYEALPGDLYFCPPGTINAITARGDDPFLLTGIDFDFTLNHRAQPLSYSIDARDFNPDYMTEIAEFSDFDGFETRFSLSGDNTLHHIILDMIHEYSAQKKHWQNYTNALLQTFIIQLMRRQIRRRQTLSNHKKMDDIIQYLADNFSMDLTNELVAKRFHYHPDYISKIIHSYTGLTLKQYIINLRLRESMNLLRHSDKPIKEIARAVGYDNLHYYTRLFKMKTGVTPGQYRRM